jgi:hypothetical protein
VQPDVIVLFAAFLAFTASVFGKWLWRAHFISSQKAREAREKERIEWDIWFESLRQQLLKAKGQEAERKTNTSVNTVVWVEQQANSGIAEREEVFSRQDRQSIRPFSYVVSASIRTPKSAS